MRKSIKKEDIIFNYFMDDFSPLVYPWGILEFVDSGAVFQNHTYERFIIYDFLTAVRV